MTNPTTDTITVVHRPLSAADILAPVLPEPFPIPEMGGVVYLRPLSAADAFEFVNGKGDGWESAILGVISKAVVDAEGKRLFADLTTEQLSKRLPLFVFNRLQKEVNRQMDAGYGPTGNAATSADTGGEPVTNPFGPSSSGESEPEAPTPDNPIDLSQPTQTPPAPAS